MKNRRKKLLVALTAVMIVCLTVTNCACFLKHIEDTNGEEDTALCSTTEETLCQKWTSYVNWVSTSQKINNKIFKFSSHKMSDVMKLFSFTASAGQTYSFSATSTLSSGNLRVYFLHDGRIIEDIAVGKADTVTVGGINGEVQLRIAGESANFSLEIEKI